MRQSMNEQVKEYKRRRRFRSRWTKLLGIMACVVVFCTTYALILPAITLESATTCGLVEHSHGEDCYETVLVCEQEETDAVADLVLTCGLTEGEGAHSHTEDCYEQVQTLVCELEEGEEHTHIDACYTVESILTCTQEEQAGHVHGDDCYETVTAEAGHIHGEDCYEKILTCEIPEHQHTEACTPEETQSFTSGNLFTTLFGGICVEVEAPAGAFPDNTSMKVSKAPAEAVQAAADAVGVDTSNVKAVDIAFYDADGNEVQPAVPVSVKLTANLVKEADEAVVVHVDDNANATVIENTDVTDKSVTFEADSFSVYAIAEKPRYTFQFYAGNGTEGTPTETQIVKIGDTLIRPATPPLLEGYNDFVGWYVGGEPDADNIWTGGYQLAFGEFTSDVLTEIQKQTNVGDDGVISVHARFRKAVIVTFYGSRPNSEDPLDMPNILKTVSMAGGPIDLSAITAPSNQAGMVFDKWVDENGVDVPLNHDGLFEPDEDTSLYPVFAEGHSLIFAVGEDATPIATQYLKGNAVTTCPADPQRPGYSFAGWYTDEAGTTLFRFGSALTEDTTVYAHWTAGTANYTVVFWQQQVTDDKNAADADKKYDYVSSEVRSALTGSTVTAAEADTKKDYVGFHYNSNRTDQAVVVEPDGSTILNVYYDRNLITMNFNSYRETNSNTDTPQYGLVDNEYVQLTQENNRWYYTDDNSRQQTYNGPRYIRTSNLVYTGLYGQTFAQNGYTWPSAGNNQVWQYYKKSSSELITVTFLDTFVLTPATQTSVEFTPTQDRNNRSIKFYKENLDGTWELANEATGSGSNFNISDKYTGYYAYQYRTNNERWTTLGTLNPTTGYYAVVSSYNSLDIRYKRNTYNLDFKNGTGDNAIVHTAEVTYGADISELKPDDDISNYPDLTYPGVGEASHYYFKGWYADPEGVVPFDWNRTMPANNLIVYAIWAPLELKVILDANGGRFADAAGTPADTVTLTVNYGDKLENLPPDPTYTVTVGEGDDQETIIYMLVGWEDKDGNAWNFNSPVTEDMTLYAQWSTDHALRVVYSVNGDVNQVTDESNYANNATAFIKPYGASGERFVGWRLGSEERIYTAGDTIDVTVENDALDGKVDNNVTLTAVFDELITTSITFDANSGTFTDGSTYVKNLLDNNEGVDLDSIPNPTRAGYKFLGWAKTAEATAAEYTGDGDPATQEIAVDNANEGSNILYAVWEKILTVDLTIKKIDSTTKVPLSGAVFTFTKTQTVEETETTYYYDSTTGWQEAEATLTTGTDGTITLPELENGAYTLTETKALDGYNPLTDPITITVKDGEAVASTGDKLQEDANRTSSSTSEKAYILIVPNSAGERLPNTGGIGTTMYTAGGLFMMVFAIAGCLMYSGRKRRGGDAE